MSNTANVNLHEINKLYVLCFFIIGILFLYAPFFVYPFCTIILICGVKDFSAITVIYMLAIFGISINVASFTQFTYHQADFTTYYNNYLTFVENGIQGDFFTFFGGIELLFPVINYLISIIVGEKLPYLYIMIHNLIQCTILFFVVHCFAKRYNLTLIEFSILLGMVLIFYKYLGMLNHMRQSYASLFILWGVFTRNNKSKIILLIVAAFFHVSSFIIYPIINFVFNNKSKRIKLKFIVGSIVLSLLIVIVYSSIKTFIYSFYTSNILVEKLLFGFQYDFIKDGSYLVSLFVANVKSNIYLILIGLILFFLNIVKESNEAKLIFINILCIIIPTLSFFYIASTVNRLFESITVVGVGFICFLCFRYVSKLFRIVSIAIFLSLVFRWVFFDAQIYNRIDLVGTKPFYYVPLLFTEQEKVERFWLPSLEDIDVKNNRW
tara:strand:+ start:924 stop:2231 length:1308 start_codon:yes stop_codon:yes gene_type:complete